MGSKNGLGPKNRTTNETRPHSAWPAWLPLSPPVGLRCKGRRRWAWLDPSRSSKIDDCRCWGANKRGASAEGSKPCHFTPVIFRVRRERMSAARAGGGPDGACTLLAHPAHGQCHLPGGQVAGHKAPTWRCPVTMILFFNGDLGGAARSWGHDSAGGTGQSSRWRKGSAGLDPVVMDPDLVDKEEFEHGELMPCFRST
jgi:hypothetical protein